MDSEWLTAKFSSLGLDDESIVECTLDLLRSGEGWHVGMAILVADSGHGRYEGWHILFTDCGTSVYEGWQY